ncbi:MAG: hypothetical protein RSB93_05810 [Rikenellaceae bacterium]
MFVVNGNGLKYSWTIESICEILLLDTSYKEKSNVTSDAILSSDEREFVLNRVEKALLAVVRVFGDAYVTSSLFVDRKGSCGFETSLKDRAIADIPVKMEILDILIRDYVVSYVKGEWEVLLKGTISQNVSLSELFENVNPLFSYKCSKSYEIKGV